MIDRRLGPIAFLMALWLFPDGLTAGITFNSIMPYPLKTRPGVIVSADFTGTGKLDLAVNHGPNPDYLAYRGGYVDVFLGRGDGSFQYDASYPSGGAAPTGLVAADLYASGLIDLACANANSSDVGILRGVGNGTFNYVGIIALSMNTDPLLLASGDFRGSGYQDLAVPTPGENNIAILFTNGAAWGNKTPYVGNNPQQVAVGDFQGRGVLDLAVVNQNSRNICILFGNGDGTFRVGNSYYLGDDTQPYRLALGDFNQNGFLDIVVISQNSNQALFLWNQGDGTFSLGSPAYSVGNQPNYVQVADMNGNGRLDVVVSNYGDGTISILWGDGQGGFAPAEHYPLPKQLVGEVLVQPLPISLVVGDFNRDGYNDLAVACSGDTPGVLNEVLVLLQSPSDNWKGVPAVTSGGNRWKVPRLDDWDAWRRPKGWSAHRSPPFKPMVFSRDFYWAGISPVTVAVGDFNRDGHLDLAISDSAKNAVSLLLGNGNGSFQRRQLYPSGGTGPTGLIVADFNQDGALDVAVSNSSAGNVAVLFGDGQGRLAKPAIYPVGNMPQTLAWGDFEADGYPDVAVPNSFDNTVTVLLNDKQGLFTEAVDSPYEVGENPQTVAVGDFNRDGWADLAVANQNSNDLTILLGGGAGRFTRQPNTLKVEAAPNSVAVGDFDRNGWVDLAVANGNSNTVSILLNQGDGTAAFRDAVAYIAGKVPQRLQVGDMSGHGFLDIVTPNSYGRSISILRGRGDGTFEPPLVYPHFPPQPNSVALGDFDSDGRTDLAVAIRPFLFDFIKTYNLVAVLRQQPAAAAGAVCRPPFRVCFQMRNARI